MKYGIRTQTLLLGIIPSLLMFLILFGFFLNARLDEIDVMANEKGQLLAKHIALASEFDILIGDIDKLEETSKRYVNDEELAFIEIRNNADRVLVHVRNSYYQNISNLITKEAQIIQPKTNISAEPFTEDRLPQADKQILGEVLIGMNTDKIVEKQKSIILNSILLALFALFASIIFAWLIGTRISQPLIALTNLVAKLKQGKVHSRSPEKSPGQIGELEKGINTLAKNILEHEKNQKSYINALEKSKKAAEQASIAKSEFLATMSHELRTPMNGALGMLELLQHTSLNSQQQHYAKTASESTQHLLTVVNDILDFSRIEQGKLTLEYHYFSLSNVITQCIESFIFETQHKNLKLTTKIDPKLNDIEINQDEARIKQILINLLGNAVKFTTHGSVTLSVSIEHFYEKTAEIKIVIKDTGIGIPEKQISTIFEAFNQADSSQKRKFEGSGLGLAIVKNLCDAMGANISVESKPDSGSIFTITLSCTYREKTLTLNNTHPIDKPLHGHILVVEDNLVNQMVVVGMLKKMGLTVHAVNGGKESLDFLQNNPPPDIILMDCQMPGMNGLEATKKIRSSQSLFSDVIIIALTANALESDREVCLNIGMNDYLSKPVKIAQLYETIKKWLYSSKNKNKQEE